MYKYNCLNAISEVGLNHFSADYEQAELWQADAVLVRSADMHDMDIPDNVLAVARAGAGVNNIPLDKCAEKGVVVFNTPGANANAVKELVISGMLLACRDIVGGAEWVLENASDPDISKITEKAKKKFAGTELMGKSLGVIGLGAIGVKVANLACELGMVVYGYDPYLSVDAAWSLSRNVNRIMNLQDIYKRCDFISVHVPLMEETRGMINKEAIASMKEGVVILNYARDLLADEDAVLEGIEKGIVKHYVTDFPNTRIAGKPGVICTPHLGASTAEAEENCAEMAVEELMEYLENGNIVHSVNFPSMDMGVPSCEARICVLHKNVAGMISKFTTVCGEAGLNIDNMSNKSTGERAYTVLDVEGSVDDECLNKLQNINGVYKVRVID